MTLMQTWPHLLLTIPHINLSFILNSPFFLTIFFVSVRNYQNTTIFPNSGNSYSSFLLISQSLPKFLDMLENPHSRWPTFFVIIEIQFSSLKFISFASLFHPTVNSLQKLRTWHVGFFFSLSDWIYFCDFLFLCVRVYFYWILHMIFQWSVSVGVFGFKDEGHFGF